MPSTYRRRSLHLYYGYVSTQQLHPTTYPARPAAAAAAAGCCHCCCSAAALLLLPSAYLPTRRCCSTPPSRLPPCPPCSFRLFSPVTQPAGQPASQPASHFTGPLTSQRHFFLTPPELLHPRGTSPSTSGKDQASSTPSQAPGYYRPAATISPVPPLPPSSEP